MALISMAAFTAPKRRPKVYKAKDAAYAVGGNPGYYIASRPRAYPKTRQQIKVSEVADKCNIKPGIKKADLQKAMKECVGPAMKKGG